MTTIGMVGMQSIVRHMKTAALQPRPATAEDVAHMNARFEEFGLERRIKLGELIYERTIKR